MDLYDNDFCCMELYDKQFRCMEVNPGILHQFSEILYQSYLDQDHLNLSPETFRKVIMIMLLSGNGSDHNSIWHHSCFMLSCIFASSQYLKDHNLLHSNQTRSIIF